jgi:ankyrin repeat protein
MTLTVLQHVALQDRTTLSNVYERWGGDIALTPLHTAAAAGNTALVKSYLDRGVFVDTLGEYYDGINQRTPLHWAAVMGRSRVIDILLQHGAHPNALDRLGRSPLG